MAELTLPTSAYDHYGIQQQILNSLSTVPALFAPAKLPTKIALTAEGIWGDQQLAEMRLLGDDWDGYGGAAIGAEVIGASREYFAMLVTNLPAPDIQPNPNGTISFEWNAARGTAQLEIGSSKLSLYIKPQIGDPIFVTSLSSCPVVADIGRLIRSSLFARQHTEMTVATSFGRDGDGISY